MKEFTHLELLELKKSENKIKDILSSNMEKEMYSPKKETIDCILSYSKALSIRDSEYIEHFEVILN